MIQNLKNTFKSTIKSLEILYVLENTKPTARILVNEDESESILNFIKNKDLELSISNFKLKKINNENSYYSDKSIKIDRNSEEKGHFILYISKMKELAQKARAYEENDMHLELGMILGYPNCCCEFFDKNFSESNNDLTLDTLKNSEGFEFPFYTNIAVRHFDISLLNHFPCKLDCKFSIRIAKENLEIINKYSESLFEFFEKTLRCTVLYTEKDGIFLLKNFKQNGNEIIFNEVLSTIKNQLYNELKNNRKIEIINKNEIEIDNKKIDNVGIMIFT